MTGGLHIDITSQRHREKNGYNSQTLKKAEGEQGWNYMLHIYASNWTIDASLKENQQWKNNLAFPLLISLQSCCLLFGAPVAYLKIWLGSCFILSRVPSRHHRDAEWIWVRNGRNLKTCYLTTLRKEPASWTPKSSRGRVTLLHPPPVLPVGSTLCCLAPSPPSVPALPPAPPESLMKTLHPLRRQLMPY